jgi:hypothetical protein
LDFGLDLSRCVRADEKLTAFEELESAIRLAQFSAMLAGKFVNSF